MSKHQKRITILNSWPIPRKTNVWVARPRPGPHSSAECIPLVVVVRDMLKLADNAREVKRILHEGGVLIDGRVRKDLNYPVGIFDVVSVPLLDKQYRMLKNEKGQFNLSLLESGQVRKLARIDNKTILKGNRVQLNLSDGTNALTDEDYHTGDSLVLSIPDRKIEDSVKFETGNLCMVVGGSHSGETGFMKELVISKSSHPNRVRISGQNGDFETIVHYVYMIGRDKPVIKLGANE